MALLNYELENENIQADIGENEDIYEDIGYETEADEELSTESDAEETEVVEEQKEVETETEEDDDDLEEAETEDENVEYEEIELPQWVDDNLIPPEKFNSKKEELEWYRNKYEELLTFYSKKEFVDQFIKAYEEKLIEKEKNVETLKATAELLEGNPELALKLYAPHYLAKNNIDYELTTEDIYNIIDYNLKKEYGEDYQLHFKPEDKDKKGTLSYNMYRKQEKLLQQIQEYQEKQRQIAQQYRQPTQEEIQKMIEEEYEKDFKEAGYSKEDFNKFYEEVKKAIPKLKLKDYHRILYFKDYLKEAYQKGLQDGKKDITKKLNTAKQKIINNDSKYETSKINFAIDNLWLKKKLEE